MLWACGKHGGQAHNAYGGTLKERDRFEDLVVDGTITLNLVYRADISVPQCLFDIILKTRGRFNLLNTREKFRSETVDASSLNSFWIYGPCCAVRAIDVLLLWLAAQQSAFSDDWCVPSIGYWMRSRPDIEVGPDREKEKAGCNFPRRAT
jgi:hypothetical protein